MEFKTHRILLLAFYFNITLSCPFIIENNSNHKIIVVDPNNKQAIHIDSGEKQEIDPSISGWSYYFVREKLDVYVPKPNNPHLFYRQYQLQEKYCTKGKTELPFKQIIAFATKPTKRFEVLEFTPHKHTPHTH